MSASGSGPADDNVRAPRAATWLLRLLLPAQELEPVLGDLEEELRSNVAKLGPRRATRMYWKEAMSASWPAADRLVEKNALPLVGVVLGLLGGGVLIAGTVFSRRGPVGFVIYAALMLAAGVYLRVAQVASLKSRFLLSLVVFTTASLMLWVFVLIIMDPNPGPLPLGGIIWRIGSLLAPAALSA